MSTADKLLAIPLVDLRTRIDTLSTEQREAAERELSHLSQRAATLSAYLIAYTGAETDGSEDKNHVRAVKHAQRVTTRVRKALGYVCPKFTVSF